MKEWIKPNTEILGAAEIQVILHLLAQCIENVDT